MQQEQGRDVLMNQVLGAGSNHNRVRTPSRSGLWDLPVSGQDYRLENAPHTFRAANVRWCEHSGRAYPVFTTPGVRTWRYRLALGI